jgi:nitrogen fixation/metabolism regulation signal transduction histidine kinase
MVKRTQGLPINTVVIAIIAIIVAIFLALISTGGVGKFSSSTNQISPSSNQIISAQCSQYATAIQQQMGTSTDPSSQLQMLATSQYVFTNCSVRFQYSFTLYNGSEVLCGLGSDKCLYLSNQQNNQECTPPNGIPGCQLK